MHWDGFIQIGDHLYIEDELSEISYTACVTLVFSFSHSRETYNALTNWLTDARTLASPNIVIVLVGNKRDLDADREVTFMEASRFAQENGEITSRTYFCM